MTEIAGASDRLSVRLSSKNDAARLIAGTVEGAAAKGADDGSSRLENGSGGIFGPRAWATFGRRLWSMLGSILLSLCLSFFLL